MWHLFLHFITVILLTLIQKVSVFFYITLLAPVLPVIYCKMLQYEFYSAVSTIQAQYQ